MILPFEFQNLEYYPIGYIAYDGNIDDFNFFRTIEESIDFLSNKRNLPKILFSQFYPRITNKNEGLIIALSSCDNLASNYPFFYENDDKLLRFIEQTFNLEKYDLNKTKEEQELLVIKAKFIIVNTPETDSFRQDVYINSRKKKKIEEI